MSKRVFSVCVLGSAFLSGSLHAAVLTRTIGAGTWDFNTTKFTSAVGVNWTNNADTANFDVSGGDTGYLITVDNTKGQVGAYGITFGNSAGNWMFIGQPLQLGAGGLRQTLANATAGLTFSNTVEVLSPQTWSINAARPIKAFGPVTGSGDLLFDALNQGGTLTLSGANTRTGALTARNGGTLLLDYSLQNNDKLDPNGTLTLGNTMTVQWTGGSLFTQAVSGVTLEGPGDLYVNRSGGANVFQLGTLARTGTGATFRVNAANVATTSSGNESGILGGWATAPAGWAFNASGGANGAIDQSFGTTDNNPATGWTPTENVNHTAALSGSLTSRTVNALRLGGPSSLNLNGATLTLASGGLMAANNNPVVTNGVFQSGLASGELFVWTVNNSALTADAAFQDNGAVPAHLVKGGSATLTLRGANTYSGGTYVNQGTLQVGQSGVLPDGTLYVGRGATCTFSPVVTQRWAGVLSGHGSLTCAGNGVLELSLRDSGTVGQVVQSAAQGTLSLTGAPGTTHTLTQNGFRNTNTGTIRIMGGVWDTPNLGQNNTGQQMRGTNVIQNAHVRVTNNGRYATGNFLLSAGGKLEVLLDRFAFATEQTVSGLSYAFDIADGGALEVAATAYGSSVGGASGVTAWINQTAGTATFGVNGAGSNRNLVLGGTSASSTSYYALSGGSLLVAGTLSAGAGGRNDFVWTGGTLAANAFTTAGFSGNTLTNAGGVLAPGDIGRPGRTTLTGPYVVASADAQLAVDLGGTTAASVFQDTAAKYDLVNVNNGAATLGGALRVSLVNGFAPAPANTFDVLTSTGTGSGLSGSFVNAAGGQVLASDGLTRFDVAVDTVNKRVRLSNAAVNQWANASGADWTAGASWTFAEPDGSDYAALFGPALAASGTVALDAARTVRALVFTDSAAAYPVAGAGSLTL